MIIAIVGMTGSGKSEVSGFLKELGIPGIRFGEFVMEEVKKQGLEVTPENEKLVREELRRRNGMDALAKLALPFIEEKLLTSSTIALDGLYSFSELKTLRTHFGDNLVLIAIFTPRRVRYDRLATRQERPLTRDQAEARDNAEIENIEKGGPIAMADYTILNNGTMEELRAQVNLALKEIGNLAP